MQADSSNFSTWKTVRRCVDSARTSERRTQRESSLRTILKLLRRCIKIHQMPQFIISHHYTILRAQPLRSQPTLPTHTTLATMQFSTFFFATMSLMGLASACSSWNVCCNSHIWSINSYMDLNLMLCQRIAPATRSVSM